MSWKDAVNEGTIALALIVVVALIVAVVIVSGAHAVGPTGLRDLGLLLGGALAGTKVPRSPS